MGRITSQCCQPQLLLSTWLALRVVTVFKQKLAEHLIRHSGIPAFRRYAAEMSLEKKGTMPLENQHQEEIKPQWRARLEDPLSASTRGKRRLLMVTSTVTLIVVILGFFPTKIEALGIAFETKNQKDLLLLLGVVNTYALLGYLLYAWADIHVQRRMQSAAATGYINEFMNGQSSFLEFLNYMLRFLFDFVVPLSYGAYALMKLYPALHPAAS